MERPRETTSDNDIAGYQWILVDTDPVRPSGVSASQPEKEAARKVSATVMKKLMAMNVMQVAVIFFFLCLGQKEGGMIPIFDPAVTDAASYINPLPHCLMLTAIVVSLGTTGVAIALLMRIKEVYGSVEEVEVIRRASK